MPSVASSDGTQIAYDVQGTGPAIILVDGALCYRGFGPMPGLAKLLEPHFTVYTYDRRGRGDSGNTQSDPSQIVACEVEDIAALIRQAGGSAYLFGASSGAALAMEAALRLGESQVKKLAMYEAPFNSDPGAPQAWRAYRQKLNDLLAENRRGDMAALFMQFVGTPADMVNGMRQSPMWPMFEAVAPTLLNDAADLGEDRSVPVQRAASITVPALVMNGGESRTIAPFMVDTAQALAKDMPKGQYRELPGQRHDVDVAVLAPVLVELFSA